jgi:hypothetical protein
MMYEVKVKAMNQYGNVAYYPDCPTALVFAKIAGTKTLTDHTLSLISSLGYKIKVQQPHINTNF